MTNAIVYNTDLQNQLKALQDVLGFEIAEVVSKAVTSRTRFSDQAEKSLFAMSDATSKLTLALMDARTQKKHLNAAEKNDYEYVKNAAETLGNLQSKVNKVLKISRNLNSLNLELKHAAIELAEELMTAQQYIHNVQVSQTALKSNH